jgi:hypothetical protein
MRKLLIGAVALCAIAWSGAAWAIVVDTNPKTPAGPETPGTHLQITLKDDKGKTIAHKTAKIDANGHAKVDISDEEKKKAKTVVITSTDKGKTYRTEVGIDVFMQGGEIALAAVAGGSLMQTGLAVHSSAPPPMQTTAPWRMVDYSFFQFGFLGGESWTKTNADSFGPGISPGGTFFPHTFSNPIFGLNAGFFVPVFPGVAAGPVVNFITGDLSSSSVSQITPPGIVSTSLVRRDWGIDAMGRVYINNVIRQYGFNVFVEGGAEFARYNASMTNVGVEVFQSSTSTTSPIVGGGFQFPLCGMLLPSMNGPCTLQAVFEYDHVFVDKTFSVGFTPLSAATASVKGEDRFMGGLNFDLDLGSGFSVPNWGRTPNWGW